MTLSHTHHRYTQARRLVSLANASGDRSQMAFAMRVMSKRRAAYQRAVRASLRRSA